MEFLIDVKHFLSFFGIMGKLPAEWHGQTSLAMDQERPPQTSLKRPPAAISW
jgi:hypothetical protein